MAKVFISSKQCHFGIGRIVDLRAIYWRGGFGIRKYHDMVL
jgi:hypothetical protein